MEARAGLFVILVYHFSPPSLNGSCHSGNEDLMITHHHHLSDGKLNISNIKISQQDAGQLRSFSLEMFRSVMFQLQIGPFLIYALTFTILELKIR